METLKKKLLIVDHKFTSERFFLDSLQVPVCSVISGYTRVLGIAKHE